MKKIDRLLTMALEDGGICGGKVVVNSSNTTTMNYDLLKDKQSKLNEEFSNFINITTSIVELMKANIGNSRTGALFSEGSTELLESWIQNMPESADFSENFDAWLSYITKQIELLIEAEGDVNTAFSLSKMREVFGGERSKNLFDNQKTV